MNFLAPWGFALLALIPVLVLFYLLKVRRIEAEVSSTLLWEGLVRDVAARDPWQRLRVSVLLLTQMALIALLAMGLARPFFTALAREPVHAVLVLDGSASMQATDVRPSRFEEARRLAREVLANLPEGSTATLVLAREQPEILAASSDNRELWMAALDGARSSGGPGRLDVAIELAVSLLAQNPRARLLVFSDGAIPDGSLSPSIPEGVEVHFISVAGNGENQAITAFAARPDPQNPLRQQLFARVRNFSSRSASRILALLADGQLVDSREVSLAPDGTKEMVFSDLPIGARLLEARLSGGDALPLDDRAYAVLEVRRATRVLLVSPGNLFLEKVITLMPGSEGFRTTPRRYAAIDSDGYDIVVFDGYLPETLPSGNLLVINPPDVGFVTREGQMVRPRITRWEREHPLLRYVDLADVSIARASKIVPPGWARVLVESDAGPLLLAGEDRGRKMVIVPFDLRQSNLPLSAAFPILMANILGYLEPAGAVETREVQPGSAVTVQPQPQADEVEVRTPEGRAERFPARGRPVVFPRADLPGIYRVVQRGEGREIATEHFAVNLVDEEESDIRPRSALFQAGGQAGAQGEWVVVRREVWLWVAVAALMVLVFEWWWYHRRA